MCYGSSGLLIDTVSECFECDLVVYLEGITFVAFRIRPKSFNGGVGVRDDICFRLSTCELSFHEDVS